MIREAFEHPSQAGLRILVFHLDGLDEGIGDGGGFAATDCPMNR